MRESLQAARAEQDRLRECLEHILVEVEAKAPTLQRQREEYEAALDRADDLERKLQDAHATTERLVQQVGSWCEELA